MAVGVGLNFESKTVKDFFTGIQKNVKDAQNGERKYALAVGALVFKDVMRHFSSEEGPKGRWKDWSDIYTEHMLRIGKGGNHLLQDSGRLRNNFKPGQYTKKQEGLEWFNDAKTRKGFPYAAAHDNGGDILPQREFMWASAELMDNIARITLAFALEGKV